jgi:hypothetical protein
MNEDKASNKSQSCASTGIFLKGISFHIVANIVQGKTERLIFVWVLFSKYIGDTCGCNRINWPQSLAIVNSFKIIYLNFCNISNTIQLFLILFYNAFNMRVVTIVC